MLLLSVAVLFISSLSTAQDDSNCVCIPYFYCNGTQLVSNKCTEVYDVCCEMGSTTVSPEPIPAIDGILCGLRGKSKEDPGSVIGWKVIDDEGDTSTAFGEFPWMVAVMKVNPSGDQEFLCGGSIIYPNIILTTAHTVNGVSASELRVKAGIWNTTDVSEVSKHQDRLVSQIVSHSAFDKVKVANDFALLVLNEALDIKDNVAPVCLPALERPINRSNCIATGWGAGNFGNKTVQSVLKKVNLPLVDFDTCQSELRDVPKLGSSFNLHNSFICAGRDKADTCTGDGGGPLMCATLVDPNRFVQVGITSWGIGCAQRTPGVYSSVEAAAQWIESQVDLLPDTRVGLKSRP